MSGDPGIPACRSDLSAAAVKLSSAIIAATIASSIVCWGIIDLLRRRPAHNDRHAQRNQRR